MVTFEHAPPPVVGVTLHCPVLASHDAAPQSVGAQALDPVIAHPPKDRWQKPDRQPCPHSV